MAAYFQDTIAAISTPLGEGGIGVVRLSGPDATRLASLIFLSNRNGGLLSHRFVFGEIIDPLSRETLDEVLVVAMLAPHSYTREDVVEIQCHGGFLMVQRILALVLASGARLAEPGEFTRRAFLNGRIDLVQAEAVIDVIRAKTEASLALAQRQREGVLSRQMFAIRDDLRHALALTEAYIDFPDEELDGASLVELFSRLDNSMSAVTSLLESFSAGRVLREGIAVSIVGRPNVGKSSLLNALLREARAIVTSVPGTTRDVIEEVLNLYGLPVRLLDTAGIRDTDDLVEREGIRRSLAKIKESDLVIFLVDGSTHFTDDDAKVLANIGQAVYLPVVTKGDLPRVIELPDTVSIPPIQISTRTGDGLEVLRRTIYDLFLSGQARDSRDLAVVSHARHRDSLARCIAALSLARQGLDSHSQLELVAADLRHSLQFLGEITGETAPDEVLDLIFNRFCIGK
jgi:tRNA modification GTPase